MAIRRPETIWQPGPGSVPVVHRACLNNQVLRLRSGGAWPFQILPFGRGAGTNEVCNPPSKPALDAGYGTEQPGGTDHFRGLFSVGVLRPALPDCLATAPRAVHRGRCAFGDHHCSRLPGRPERRQFNRRRVRRSTLEPRGGASVRAVQSGDRRVRPRRAPGVLRSAVPAPARPGRQSGGPDGRLVPDPCSGAGSISNWCAPSSARSRRRSGRRKRRARER